MKKLFNWIVDCEAVVSVNLRAILAPRTQIESMRRQAAHGQVRTLNNIQLAIGNAESADSAPTIHRVSSHHSDAPSPRVRKQLALHSKHSLVVHHYIDCFPIGYTEGTYNDR